MDEIVERARAGNSNAFNIFHNVQVLEICYNVTVAMSSRMSLWPLGRLFSWLRMVAWSPMLVYGPM